MGSTCSRARILSIPVCLSVPSLFPSIKSPPDYTTPIWASLLQPPNQRPRLRLQPVRHGRINARSLLQPQGVSVGRREKKNLRPWPLAAALGDIDWGVGRSSCRKGAGSSSVELRLSLSVCLVCLSNLPLSRRAIVCLF
ncbi:hypothetical protein HDV57DRAFT_329943 [Trichoderma longibrachiatum]